MRRARVGMLDGTARVRSAAACYTRKVSLLRLGMLGLWLSAGCAGSAAAPTSLPPVTSGTRPVAVAPLTAAAGTRTSDYTAPPDLFIRCDDLASCSSAVGMLVVDDASRPEPERCTATLIAPNRVLTAIHCLSAVERQEGASCRRTWVSFPQTANAPSEWASCERVVVARGVVSHDGLKQEHAVLELARPLARSILAIDPRPPEPNSIVEVISVTPHPVYGITHQLASRLCRAIDAQPAIDALGAAAADVGWLANCPIARGNSGSPVLDRTGRIRAMVHGGTSTTFAIGVTSGL